MPPALQVYSLTKWLEPELATAVAVLVVFPMTEYPVAFAIQMYLSQMYLLQVRAVRNLSLRCGLVAAPQCILMEIISPPRVLLGGPGLCRPDSFRPGLHFYPFAGSAVPLPLQTKTLSSVRCRSSACDLFCRTTRS